MSSWIVADSLYNEAAYFCGHLSSYAHYLRALDDNDDVTEVCLTPGIGRLRETGWDSPDEVCDSRYPMADFALILDRYDWGANVRTTKRIAQVAAVCPVMPWDVRGTDGSPAYDCVISSVPWMVDAARAAGCRAEYMPLAFDTRARVCGMGVTRDLECIFIGTTGPNHKRRTQLLDELKDVVTVLPPVFGREYFKTLARAKVVLNVHAEWARGAANNMRIYEATGMGAMLVSDGPKEDADWHGYRVENADEARADIEAALRDEDMSFTAETLTDHTYESRIPQLVDIARSL